MFSLLRKFKNRVQRNASTNLAQSDPMDLLYSISSRDHVRCKAFAEILPDVSEGSFDISHECSKTSPSYWHETLSNLYKDLHLKFKSPNERKGAYFNGSIFCSFADEVRMLVKLYGCISIFDYGSGSADAEVYSWLTPLGIETVHSYDLGVVNQCTTNQETKCDLVVCCDVLEHVHVADMAWTIKDIFDKANKVVFITVSSRKAVLRFSSPNYNDQVHITVMPPAWWFAYILAISSSYPAIRFYLCVDGPSPSGSREKSWFSNHSISKYLYNSYSSI